MIFILQIITKLIPLDIIFPNMLHLKQKFPFIFVTQIFIRHEKIRFIFNNNIFNIDFQQLFYYSKNRNFKAFT